MGFSGIKAIVTDIEGTTSSLSFVKEVLFPYARSQLVAFVSANGERPEVAKLLNDADEEMGGGHSQQEIAEQMLLWIDEDKKITALKSLQGLIWEQGYRQGDFTGHLYEDAAIALRQWHAQGLRLFVYSSGSVYAQKLLFGFSDYGDLTPLFEGYFDTHIGHKREVGAYQAIVAQLALEAESILFLSDITEELDAAQAAGMQTCCLVREPTSTGVTTHPQVTSFAELQFD